ncbi:Lrp/AsnC family transcriptional regulator [Paracoccus jeotgali]|uniref:AsnC family transcriptional regulator n=1 Tax=Paracoccus jeotgali TaxID=2065379 RepID=A0A2K9MGW3_9RHOB|nr:Lrp/AsnC family transcriptional regulator [Paracoccus jeotgali]AUM74844.1 AsnC family transcriptional regulator [Paracoccus jeotgali]
MTPDATDLAILRLLSRDATLGAAGVGRALGLTQPAIWRRIRRMQDHGIIAGQRVQIDTAALGFGVTVFLGIRLATKGRTSLDEFERAVTAIPEVQTVQHVLGQFDYRLRILARDIADFERILRRRIMTLPGIGQVEANVLLSEERRPGPLGSDTEPPPA